MSKKSDFDGLIKKCRFIAGPFPPSAGKCDYCGKKRPEGRKRWCSDECSRAIWNTHSFPVTRKAALKRDGYKCRFCGKSSYLVKLEVDHIKAAEGRHGILHCVHHVENLRTLCEACHKKVTRNQRASGVVAKGKIPSRLKRT